MRRFLLIALGLVASLTNPVFANDHNNLDSGRPLSFDDAESIGFGEQSIEFGGSLVFPENSNLGGEFDIEYLNGIIRNGHIISASIRRWEVELIVMIRILMWEIYL